MDNWIYKTNIQGQSSKAKSKLRYKLVVVSIYMVFKAVTLSETIKGMLTGQEGQGVNPEPL